MSPSLIVGLLILTLAGCAAPQDPLPEIPAVDSESFLPAVAKQLASLRADVDENPSDAAAAGRLGMAFMAYGLDHVASAAFERAVRLQPDNWEWRYLHALTLTVVGDFAAGVALLEQIARQEPENLVVRLRLGQAYTLQGAHGMADEVLSSVVATDPAFAEAVLSLAKAQVRDGRPGDAIAQLDRLLATHGPSEQAFLTLADAWRALGDADRSGHYRRRFERYRGVGYRSRDTVLQRVASFNVGDKPLVTEARRLLAQGNVDNAIPVMREALRRNPNNLAVHEALIREFTALGQFDEAGEQYRRTLALGPPGPSLLVTLGQLRAAEGRDSEARDALLQALELDPGSAAACTLLGVLSRRRNDAASALSWFDRALRLDPNARDARMQLAELMLIDRRFDVAVGHLEQLAMPDSEQSVRALIYLGQALAELGRRDEAGSRLRQAARVATRIGNDEAAARAREFLASIESAAASGAMID